MRHAACECDGIKRKNIQTYCGASIGANANTNANVANESVLVPIGAIANALEFIYPRALSKFFHKSRAKRTFPYSHTAWRKIRNLSLIVGGCALELICKATKSDENIKF